MSAMSAMSPTGPAPVGAMPDTVVPLTSMHPMARVNLMPPEIASQRRFRRAQLGMAGALVVSLLVAGVTYLLSWQAAQAADAALLAEQAQTAQLTTEASTYNDVPVVLTAIERSRAALSTVMAREVAWYPYLYQLSLSAPPSLWFEQISFTSVAPGTAAVDPLAPVDTVATVSTSGQALAYADVVSWVQEMDSVAAWDHALLSDTTNDPTVGAVSFTSTAELSAQAFSNRYPPGDPAAPTAAAPTTETSE